MATTKFELFFCVQRCSINNNKVFKNYGTREALMRQMLGLINQLQSKVNVPINRSTTASLCNFFFQCVFVDSTNKKLFYTSDNGRTIHRSDLSFHPSELAFDEEFPDKYVILDKVDSNRKVRTVLLI